MRTLNAHNGVYMKSRKIKIAVLCLICLAAAILPLTGCTELMIPTSCEGIVSYDYEFGFNNPQITMFSGEKRVFSTDDFTVSGDDTFFALKSVKAEEGTNVVSVSKTTVTAITAGKCVLTATAENGKTARCTVTVRDALGDLSIETNARAVNVGKEAVLYAVINGEETTSGGVEWKIDGVKQSYDGGEFSFTSNEAKKVKAEISYAVKNKKLTDEINVYFYDGPITATLNDGEEKLVLADVTEGAAAIDWFINGEELLSNRDETELDYSSYSPGGYKVEAAVNGVKTEPKIVKISGARIPSSVEIDIDRNDKKVAASWDKADANETFEVSYRNGGSEWKTATVETNEILIDRYDGTGATILDVTKDIELKVKSNGNADYLTSSDYSQTVKSSGISAEAVPFLDNAWYGGNYYVTSDEEFCDIYDYFMLFRKQPKVEIVNGEYKTIDETHGGGDVYLGYTSDYVLDRLCSVAFNRASYTGSYSTSYSSQGNVVKLGFTFKTASYPVYSTHTQEAGYNGTSDPSLYGTLPHVSGTDYVGTLPIDEITATATVSTTDQLYRVAEQGFKPLPESGSRAEKYYALAKETVRSIVDESMNDYEKAHAIYDWIEWRVVYATEASKTTEISKAVLNSAYYVEGVFDSGNRAVCDGKSKAFSLMCNIAGVKCVRVVGDAGENGNLGGHAWNKVNVGGRWYIVDTTWGDISTTLSKTSVKEVETHAYLFKTDGELGLTHFEAEDTAYPATSAIPYDVVAVLGSSDTVATRVTAFTDVSDYAEAVASYVKSLAFPRSFDMPNAVYDSKSTPKTTIKTVKSSSKYVTVEISVAANVAGGVNAVDMAIKSKFGGLFSPVEAATFVDGNVVRLLAWKK